MSRPRPSLSIPLQQLLALAASVLLAGSPAAASPQATASLEQLTMTAAQISQAGIVTAPVATAQAENAAAEGNALVLSGTVVAPTSAVVLAATPMTGVITRIHVASLQTLQSGAPLVTLFSPSWMAAQRDYVTLAAQSGLAASKLVRDESLFADGIIAHARLDESRSAATLARLAADQAAQSLRAGGLSPAAIKALPTSQQLSPQLTLRAQVSGTVLELPVTLGQQLEAGMAVVKIGRDGPLWVELQASRQQLPMLAIGDLLKVTECGQLRVIAISPIVNGVNQTAQVRAQQVERNACLKVNAFVEARLTQPRVQAGALIVPGTAIVRRGALSYVFVRNATGFQVVPVTTGAAGADQVWVSGTLRPGAQVAVRGLAAIKGAWSGLGEAPAAPVAKGTP